MWWQGQKIQALIDSGAQGNFINPTTVNRLKIPWRGKEHPYHLKTVDGSAAIYDNGVVGKETDQLLCSIASREIRLTLDITNIARQEMILGLPWLRSENRKSTGPLARCLGTVRYPDRI